MASEKHEPLNPRYLDRRVLDRYIKRGVVDEKELARHLKALPDMAEQSAKVETEFQPAGELGPAR